jgi:signal transduction histidine kinase
MVTPVRHSLALPPVLLDVGLAVGTAVFVIVSIWVTGPGGSPPGLSTQVAGAAIAVPLVARRRYPLGVLLACTALLLVFYWLHHQAGLTPGVPLAVALYTAAEYGYLRWSLAVSGGFVAAGTYVLIVSQHRPAIGVLSDFVQEGSLLVAICLLGEAVRSRRGWAAEIRDRLDRAAAVASAEREREADRRVEQERLRIARELHDVLAHTISALTVQARVILDGLPDGPPQVRAAAEAIRSTSREAMAEVRATVGLLRSAEEATPQAPPPGLGQLDAALGMARATGLRAEREVVGAPVPLPASVELTAYRIVQESLTNVVRHAGANAVTVTLRYLPYALEVQVDDDGRGPATKPSPAGYGLVGMAERAQAVGGWLVTAGRPDGGFRVLARLPAEARPPTAPATATAAAPATATAAAPATAPAPAPAPGPGPGPGPGPRRWPVYPTETRSS